MLDQLDYLIRTLTYKRSSIECDIRDRKYSESGELSYALGQIDGLNISINELYKMLETIIKDDNE